MEFDDSLLVERIDDLETITTLEPEHLMTFHCVQCNTVLADSLGVCGELKCIDSVMCMRRFCLRFVYVLFVCNSLNASSSEVIVGKFACGESVILQN